MASKILLKKSTTASTVPTIADLDVGEVAINTEDKRLFTKDSGGSVVEVSTNPSTIDVTGNATIGGTLGVTGNTTLSGSLNVTGDAVVPTPSADTHAATKAYVDTSVGNVQTILDEIETIYDTFDDRYLGAKASEPSVDNDGNALIAGAMYFNTTANLTYVYTGSVWQVTALNPSDTLLVANNLSDLNNAATALTNLGITKTAAEINSLDTTVGTLTKTFTSGEQASITLDQAVSPAPVVSVTKEVAQTGVSSKGGWDVATDGSNYELHDTAYAVTLTPSSASSDGTFTLGSGSFASTDVGKRIVGNGGEAVLTAADGSYSVVTAFDDSSTIASGSWSMFALTFDGTDGVAVNTLAQGFEVANASYDSVSFSVVSEATNPSGIFLKPDGTKFYVVDYVGDTVDEYNLSTAWDLSSSSYLQSKSVASQETAPRALFFKDDGTKMYILGDSGGDVNEYNLSTAWDVSTAVYSSIFTYVVGLRLDLFFKPDGTKMYIANYSTTSLEEYDLSTAWDVTSASLLQTLDVSSTVTNLASCQFSPDGTKLVLMGSPIGYDYTLSTAWDISTASYTGNSFDFTNEDTAMADLFFKPDGLRLFAVGGTGDSVYQYTAGTAFVPTNAYHPTVTKTSGQIDTSTWTDINTMTADETLNGGEVYYAVSTDDRTTWAVIDDTDGVRPIVRNNAGTWEYNDASTYGGTTWTSATTNEELYALQEALEDGNAEEVIGFADASTWSYDDVSFSIATEETAPQGMAFNNDGTKMYIVGSTGDDVNQYTLSTAFDMSTASFDSVTFSVAAQETIPEDIVFNNDGTKMFILGQDGGDINEYALSTAFDISSASFTTNFSVSSQETAPNGLAFNNDGTKMYIVGITGDDVNQYTLSTAFDISTASFDSVTFSVASEEITPQGIAFNNDGTKMYIVGTTNDTVFQYTLSTAFDISTASYDSVSFSAGSEDTASVSILFNNDGTKMYIVGSANDTVYQYSTGSTGNFNRMNSTQLNAVTDPNHYTLGDTLDLAIMLYTASAGSIPESDGVSINYDAEALNQGAVLGTDYDFDFPDSTTVRITSNAAQNLKIRVV